MTMHQEVKKIWNPFDWAQAPAPHEKTLPARVRAFDRSPRKAQDLREIPLSLHVEDCKVSLLAQNGLGESPTSKRALKIAERTGDDRPVDQDTLIAEAFIVRHLDFMTNEPLVKGLNV